MLVKKRPVEGMHSGGSCSACSKGKLSLGGYNLKYPYGYVLEITLEGMSFRLCGECFNKLKSINFEDVPMVVNEIYHHGIEL